MNRKMFDGEMLIRKSPTIVIITKNGKYLVKSFLIPKSWSIAS